ncbi:hypothetical protein C0J52_05733 [Blattella germanica]|nr:hypothetical protein C0J52_05733 [Blattella germanica]
MYFTFLPIGYTVNTSSLMVPYIKALSSEVLQEAIEGPQFILLVVNDTLLLSLKPVYGNVCSRVIHSRDRFSAEIGPNDRSPIL